MSWIWTDHDLGSRRLKIHWLGNSVTRRLITGKQPEISPDTHAVSGFLNYWFPFSRQGRFIYIFPVLLTFDSTPLWAMTNFVIKITSWINHISLRSSEMLFHTSKSINPVGVNSLCGLNSMVSFLFKARWAKKGRNDCPVDRWKKHRFQVSWCPVQLQQIAPQKDEDKEKVLSLTPVFILQPTPFGHSVLG